MPRQLIQKASAEVPAEVRCAWTQFVAADSGIDKRTERTAIRQVELPVGRKLIEVQSTPGLRGKVVKAEVTFHRKMARGDVFQSSIETESGVEGIAKCSVRYPRPEIKEH